MTKRIGLEVRSTISSEGRLSVTLDEAAVPDPGAGEVVVRVEAAPINPSDLGLLFGPADFSTIEVGGTADRPVVRASVPAARMAGLAARLDVPMAVGNEGAGVVVAAGPGAEGLIGRAVAISGGTYAQFRVVGAAGCAVLPDGVTPREGAAWFVNPMTVLGMVETMRREGHTALVHTAAASNLGQMLARVCQADGIPLVNIVRSPRQVALLRDLGAAHVLDSTSPGFAGDLTEALAATGATLGFDAIGGGTMAATILAAMEEVASRDATSFSRYGSSVHKQVYVYGMLDTGPKVIGGNLGMAWGVGGWLLTWFLRKIGPTEAARLRARVMAELTTIFASGYTAEIPLSGMLSAAMIAAYGRRATGEKYLVVPNRSS